VVLGDRNVDLVQEGIDVALRMGQLVDTSSTGTWSAKDVGAVEAPMIRRSYPCKLFRQLVSTSRSPCFKCMALMPWVMAADNYLHVAREWPSSFIQRWRKQE
jgi:hypothetical protein